MNLYTLAVALLNRHKWLRSLKVCSEYILDMQHPIIAQLHGLLANPAFYLAGDEPGGEGVEVKYRSIDKVNCVETHHIPLGTVVLDASKVYGRIQKFLNQNSLCVVRTRCGVRDVDSDKLYIADLLITGEVHVHKTAYNKRSAGNLQDCIVFGCIKYPGKSMINPKKRNRRSNRLVDDLQYLRKLQRICKVNYNVDVSCVLFKFFRNGALRTYQV